MHHPRILVVDDDPAIIKFVRANLKADDYETLNPRRAGWRRGD